MSSETITRIGLPRAMLHHKYGMLWSTFFRMLGCEVVISPETNRQIMESGVQYSIDENCLAVKIFLGHVHNLLDKVDYIFIPHIVSLHDGENMCVRLFALGDIVRNTFCDVRILEYVVDANKHQSEIDGLIRLGMMLNTHLPTVRNALSHARQTHIEHNQAVLQKQVRMLKQDAECRVLLVAHALSFRQSKVCSDRLESSGRIRFRIVS